MEFPYSEIVPVLLERLRARGLLSEAARSAAADLLARGLPPDPAAPVGGGGRP